MFSKFKKQCNTIFVDKNSADFVVQESVNVILSPSLYWVQKLTLPVKSLREVKPLLESLFEDILPEGRYSYTAYKEGDAYFVFAYEDKVLLDLLQEKGISPAKINSVHFAQSELSRLETPKKVEDGSTIMTQDDVVVLVPQNLVDSKELLDVSNLALSKRSVTLKQFGHIVNEKSLYTVVALFVVLVVLVATQYFITVAKTDKLQTQREEIFAHYHLKPTMIQNRALLKRYEALYRSQLQFRSLMKAILSMKLPNGVSIQRIQLKNKKLQIFYSGLKKGEEKALTRIFTEKNFSYKTGFFKDIFRVEFVL